jgi:hypothetical protein
MEFNIHETRVTRQSGMAHPQVANGGERLKI